jgi:hypothetical protein
VKNIELHINKETSLAEKLREIAVSPDQLLSFLEENTEANREVLKLRKDSMDPTEFYLKKIQLNEIDILIINLKKEKIYNGNI